MSPSSLSHLKIVLQPHTAGEAPLLAGKGGKAISINPLKGKMIVNKINKNNGRLSSNTLFSFYADYYDFGGYDEWTKVTGIDKPYFMENEIISAVGDSINYVYGFRPTVLSQIKRENKFLAYIIN